MDNANFSCQHTEPDTYVTVAKFRSVTGAGSFDVENNVSRFNTVPSIPVEILSGRCPTNLNSLI